MNNIPTIAALLIGANLMAAVQSAPVSEEPDASNGIFRQDDRAVSTGYTTERESDLTCAVTTAPTEDVNNSIYTDPLRSLQGKVAGLSITDNGSPSCIGTISIRGINTIGANSEPLIVIDGVPTSNSLNTLNAHDIESIQVLKDAASTAIYGSRASNGVIVITTKRGKIGQKSTRADFNASVAVSYYDKQHAIAPEEEDWLREMAGKGITQNYDLSVTNSSEKSTQMFSVGYKKADGVLKGFDFENISARVNTYTRINRFISVGENLSVSYSNRTDCCSGDNMLRMRTTELLNDDRYNMWRILGNAFIEISPVKGLELRSDFGVDYASGFLRGTGLIAGLAEETAGTGRTNSEKWNWANTIKYTAPLPTDHKLSVLAGVEFYRRRIYETDLKYSLISFFGKLDYNWNDILLATVALNYDGSSIFAKNNRFATFPSASLGYRISKTIDASWLSELKLRVSYGQTGNQPIDNPSLLGLYSFDYMAGRRESTAYDITGSRGQLDYGYRILSITNSDLKPEITKQWNVGLDFGFFSDALFGSVDAYCKNTNDLIVPHIYPGAAGEKGIHLENGPSMRSWGMEFTLGFKNRTSSGLYYSIAANADFFRNRVSYLPEGTERYYPYTTTQNIVEARVPYGSMVGLVSDGLFTSEEEVMTSAQPDAEVGDIRYVDLTGDGIINDDDQTWIFNPVPDLAYGLDLCLMYAGLDFRMFWQGIAGKKVYSWYSPLTDSDVVPVSSYFVGDGSYFKLRNLEIGYNFSTRLLKNTKISKARLFVSGHNLLTVKSKNLICPDPENQNFAYPHAMALSAGLQLGF
ncbi:MAG: TonB-dependent receptor [Bacteroidales bacterium]|nr:TonB-dependent receptor [Bacteroidales bacterium]